MSVRILETHLFKIGGNYAYILYFWYIAVDYYMLMYPEGRMMKFFWDNEIQKDSMASSEFFGEIYRKMPRVHCTYMKVLWNITGIFVENPLGHWTWGFAARTVSNEKVFSLLSAFFQIPFVHIVVESQWYALLPIPWGEHWCSNNCYCIVKVHSTPCVPSIWNSDVFQHPIMSCIVYFRSRIALHFIW